MEQTPTTRNGEVGMSVGKVERRRRQPVSSIKTEPPRRRVNVDRMRRQMQRAEDASEARAEAEWIKSTAPELRRLLEPSGFRKWLEGARMTTACTCRADAEAAGEDVAWWCWMFGSNECASEPQ